MEIINNKRRNKNFNIMNKIKKDNLIYINKMITISIKSSNNLLNINHQFKTIKNKMKKLKYHNKNIKIILKLIINNLIQIYLPNIKINHK